MSKQYYNELARGSHLGFDWYVAHNDLGYRVGYVKLSRGHPWWMMPCDYLNEFVSVHGGLTYAEKGPPRHVPDFGYQWWIGFDCGHCWDAPDRELIRPELLSQWEFLFLETGINTFDLLSSGGTIKDLDYVIAECVGLCEQADNAIDRHSIAKIEDTQNERS